MVRKSSQDLNNGRSLIHNLNGGLNIGLNYLVFYLNDQTNNLTKKTVVLFVWSFELWSSKNMLDVRYLYHHCMTYSYSFFPFLFINLFTLIYACHDSFKITMIFLVSFCYYAASNHSYMFVDTPVWSNEFSKNCFYVANCFLLFSMN